MKLVIVESPTKAKTISKFLEKEYVVKSSFGHIRDLPKNELGVDVAAEFKPRYVIPTKSRKIVTDLKKNAKKADTIIFATDEDREGEAISWHLYEIFKKELGDELNDKKLERIAFHEITEEAIKKAIEKPREIDLHLVNAQQARRILDRLVGYELSPLLWKKVARGLSAGRVQSVALRLIVEREREIQKFKPEEYWTIEAIFSKLTDSNIKFPGKLIKIGENSLEKFSIKTKNGADKLLSDLENTQFKVDGINKKISKRSPQAPFTTSTLQQAANNKLGFSAKQTMMLAQQLYEGIDLGAEGSLGLITYMRTDSVNLSEKFIAEARDFITKNIDTESVPALPRKYKAKSKLAQEAHEAIRPTVASRTPESIQRHLEPNQYKLYELIWQRAVASQATDAEIETTSVDISHDKYTFRSSGSRILKEGYLALYKDIEKPDSLPELSEGESVHADEILPKQHFTEPPARFSDATLVKDLEEFGIGRPSTYAPTIATLLERNYVERIEGRRLKPTDIAFVVNDLLVEHFPTIVDYNFTAKMEDELDEIAEGKKEWVPTVSEFYGPFAKILEQKKSEIVKKEITETPTDQICEKCGKPMVIKIGRYGKFLACSGFPECKNTKKLESGAGGAEKPQSISSGVTCPKCEKGELISRRTRRGKIFWGCSTYPTCDFALWKKPTGQICEKCGSLIVEGAKGKIYCSNKECETNK